MDTVLYIDLISYGESTFSPRGIYNYLKKLIEKLTERALYTYINHVLGHHVHGLS